MYSPLLFPLPLSPLQCVVSCVDWSSTGSVVGVSFGAPEHDDWCDHRGTIAVWNINRSDFDANQPERVIEASSCVLSLAFHPANPALFTAGTFNGGTVSFPTVLALALAGLRTLAT